MQKNWGGRVSCNKRFPFVRMEAQGSLYSIFSKVHIAGKVTWFYLQWELPGLGYFSPKVTDLVADVVATYTGLSTFVLKETSRLHQLQRCTTQQVNSPLGKVKRSFLLLPAMPISGIRAGRVVNRLQLALKCPWLGAWCTQGLHSSPGSAGGHSKDSTNRTKIEFLSHYHCKRSPCNEDALAVGGHWEHSLQKQPLRYLKNGEIG